MSKIVGKTFISDAKIPRVDQTEKKNDATEVDSASLFTVNGIIKAKRAAETMMTTAINCTSGFRRITNLT